MSITSQFLDCYLGVWTTDWSIIPRMSLRQSDVSLPPRTEDRVS